MIETPKYVIGIDIGTGSCKAVAVAVNGEKLAESKSFNNTNNPQPGFVEQNPEEIWQNFKNCLCDILDKLRATPEAISFSSAMHGLMLINKENKPLTPLIIWADKRSEKIAEALKKGPSGKDIYNATGTPVFSMSPLCKIIWFKENQPAVFEEAVKFVSIKEYIWFRIFKEWEVDLSIASATGLLNIQTKKWHLPAMNICGITPDRLSGLKTTDYIRHNADTTFLRDIGLNNKTVFCIGASDGCLANLGSFAIEPGIGALTIGTSGAVRIASPKPLNNFKSMLFNYVLNDEIYISGGPTNNGGVVVKWLLKTFRNIQQPGSEDYKDMFKTIDEIPAGSDGLLFLPHLLGERAPVWNANATSLFCGIKLLHGQGHFLRAGVEGICFGLKSIIQSLEDIVSDIKQLNISGGFINSPLWIQMLADITGKKLLITEKKDASSIGAALLAMKKLQLIAGYNSLKPARSAVISPDEQYRRVYDDTFSIYQKLYSIGKNIH